MILEVRDLQKSFHSGFWRNRRQVLHGVSFSLPKGSTTGFIGVNGSGKTTSLKCVLGFILPEKGEIRFDDGRADLARFRTRLGYLPERPYLYDFLSAEEFLRFHWDLSGGGPGFPAMRDQVLNKVDLSGTGSKRLRQFSKGMLQRIGLAQALLRQPDLLVLDEPMSGLDPDGRLLVKDILIEEKKRGTTIFFSSHLLADMEELCDRLVVIDDGRVLFEGTQAAFLDQQSNRNLERAFSQLRTRHLRERGST